MDEPGWRPQQVHIRLIDHPAASWGEDHRRPAGQLPRQRPLHLTKRRFAACGKNLRNVHPLSHLDLAIQIHELGAEEVREQRADRAFSRTGQADKDDVKAATALEVAHPPIRWSTRAR
jgi:hypothetical protein